MGEQSNETDFSQRGEPRPFSGKSTMGLHEFRDTSKSLNLEYEVLIVILGIVVLLNEGLPHDGEMLSCELHRFGQVPEQLMSFAEFAEVFGDRRLLNSLDGIGQHGLSLTSILG